MTVPGSANPLLLRSAAPAAYQIQRSLRFNSSDSAFLSRTPASAGNRRTFTFASWVKRSGLSSTGYFHVFSAGTVLNETDYFSISFWEDKLDVTTGAADLRKTTAVYRDTSAWYHIVVAVDTTQATAANRVKVYVNGVEVTAFDVNANPTLNADLAISRTLAHDIGRNSYNSSNYFSGYLADVHFIDGQALTPSSFTEVSATTGRLEPKQYTGSFGTNGFWLKFSDNSAATATTLGKDYSGNSNNWSPTNLSVTAGAGNDSLVDTPTSYGTDTGAGGEVRGNYCTLNPLASGANGVVTFSNGNLQADWSAASGYAAKIGTIGVSSGKWYWEVLVGGSVTYYMIGVMPPSVSLDQYVGQNNGYAYYSTGTVYPGNTAYGASYATGDVIGVALDLDAGKIFFSKNGVWQNSGSPTAGTNPAFSGLTGTLFPALSEGSSTQAVVYTINFGQRPFAYTAPSGFKALCDTNLPAPTIALPSTVMDVKLYTGNGSTQTISGLGFSPDLVWIKSRSGIVNHVLADTVRGASLKLASNTTGAEASTDNGYLSAFTSDGFTVAQGGGTYPGIETNYNPGTPYVYAAWCWDAGSSTVTNTQGSITSQVRANASAGFSIVTWTGSGANATVGHGLGVSPGLVIVKQRSAGATNWVTWHSSITNTNFLLLNTTQASTGPETNVWNNTSPTSTVFTIGTSTNTNANGATYVAYLWTPVAGYSSMGSFVSNGSADNVFVYTGFRPRFLVYKSSSVAGGWIVIDTSRATNNVVGPYLETQSSAAENSVTQLDILSNGFKCRDAGFQNGTTYIYFAFAESPFQYARAR